MNQPSDFITQEEPNDMVCRLWRSLYGLIRSEPDYYVFYCYFTPNLCMYLVIYVDYSHRIDEEGISKLKNHLFRYFLDQGPLVDWCTTCEVAKSISGILTSQ